MLAKHIKDRQVTTKDVKNSSMLSGDFKPGQLPAGAQAERGSQGEPGTAREYGLVNSNATVVADKSKNVASVTRPFTGSYCVQLAAGIDASRVEATVSPNYVVAPFLPIAQINSDRSHCTGNAIKVQTSRVAQNTTTKNISEEPTDSGFFIVVP